MNVKDLEKIAKKLRIDVVEMTTEAGSGHPGGSLSATDIMAVLYFDVMKHDPKNPAWEDRDRFVLSKGHVAPILYACMAESGYFPVSELKTLRKLGSKLQGHPVRTKLPGVEASTGSLGQGLSMACGMALAGKMDKKEYRTYCMLGDGELQLSLRRRVYLKTNAELFAGTGEIESALQFSEILVIESKYGSLLCFDGFEVVLVQECRYSLWHASDQHILSECSHRVVVGDVAHRFPVHEFLLHEIHRDVVPCRPKEFFEVHREHLYAVLFRWDENAFDVLSDGYQGSCFDVEVSAVSDQMFDHLSCLFA